MSNQKLQVLTKSREYAARAVAEGVRTPAELRTWFLSNGWEYDMPTAPTLAKLLRENGVNYDESIDRWVK